MSAPSRAGRKVRTHRVVGQREHVATALERAYADGRLVDVRDVAELPDDRVQLIADLREPAARMRKRRPWLLVGWAAAVVAAAGSVWLLVLAVAALVGAVTAAASAALAWLSAHLPVIALAAIALLLLVCAAGSRCPGLHCGGCRR
jgi:hypothetical protein